MTNLKYLKKKINIVVATSGDTGSAAISALNDRKILTFLFYILTTKFQISEKIMTTIGSKIFIILLLKEI